MTDAAKQLKLERIVLPPGHGMQTITFATREFTSVCPRSGQPDFCHVTIEYTPDQFALESKSVKFYFWAFREHPGFSEEVADRIASDVQAAIDPVHVTVTVEQQPRGGVGLTVIAAR